MKLSILHKNLTFSEALEAVKEGKWIKVPEWKGYWFLKGGMIKVMTEDGDVLDSPWLKETIFREDWQIVEIDKVWEKEESYKRLASLKDCIMINNSSLKRASLEAGTPVQENSLAFEEWLKSANIDYRNSGHQTIILGNRDMFEIGISWSAYKSKNQTATEIKSPKN